MVGRKLGRRMPSSVTQARARVVAERGADGPTWVGKASNACETWRTRSVAM